MKTSALPVTVFVISSPFYQLLLLSFSELMSPLPFLLPSPAFMLFFNFLFISFFYPPPLSVASLSMCLIAGWIPAAIIIFAGENSVFSGQPREEKMTCAAALFSHGL